MAALTLRTHLLVTLLILVNSMSQIKCESDVTRPQKHTMPLLDEHLLRSGEDRPEKSAEDEVRTTKIKETMTYEESEQKPVYTTAEPPQETVEYPESIANEDEEIYEEKKAEEATTPADVTDTTSPEDIQQMTDRMDVYTKQKDLDGNNVGVDNEKTTVKTEPTLTTTSRAPPPTEPKDFVPRTSLDDPEDHEIFGQRSPKTDNSDQKPQIDKRNFDYPKPPADQPEASKSSILRDWIEDPWLRSPSAILVPLRPEALTRALAVWNDLISIGGLNVSDVVLVGYDSNGVNWRSRHNLHKSHAEATRTVSEALSRLLFKYKDVNTNEVAGDATMRALTSAAKLVPYDSALFVVTDKAPADAQRLPLALRALVEKRLKVYTVWTDPHYPSTESDVALQEMRNISAHTEGDILPYSLQVMEMDSVKNLTAGKDRWASLEAPQARTAKLSALVEDKLETLLVKRGGGDAISLGVPVETGVTGLRVYIEGAVEHAVIYPPNEAPQIDLYNQSSVESFFPGSRTDSVSPRDVYLVFPSARSDGDMLSVVPVRTWRADEGAVATAGVWHLSMRCDTCDYRLTICAHARIRFDTERLADDMLSLRVLGPVATVRESTLVDEYGTELSKLAFSYQPAAGEDDPRIGDSDQELVAEVQLPEVKEPKVYVKIVGRDLHGESFVRLSGPLNKKTAEIRTGRSASIAFPETVNDLEIAEVFSQRQYDARGRYNETQVLPNNRAASQVVNTRGTLMTTVQIGLSSRLYGAPGDSLQLHFEVTNYREQAVYFRFEAIGELRFLRGISPATQTVASGQTANVIVSVGITATAQPGARDLITFTAYGLETVSISSYVYVVNSDSVVTDTWAPTISHDFQGTCIGRMGDDCAQNAWAATVVARDAVGGLLRLSSTPIGLMYNSNFISGTREEVVATYRATCCAPRVLVTAVDAYGNANSYVVDISNYFTPASVAAIVLGVFLLIALIAILVLLIYWCVKRRKESRDMPSYATSSRRDIS